MKTISKYIGIVLTVFAISSCTGLLEEHNAVGISDICATEETLEAGILGVQYGFVPWDGLSGMGAIELDYCSGLSAWVNAKWITNAEYVANLYFTSINSGLFKVMYTTISRANDIIDNLKHSPVDESYKLEIEAEARFYRAIAYFYLVRIFGDVPLRLGTSTAEDATYCPRTPYYTIYEKVVEDFEYAAEHMRSPQRVRAVTPGYHRPNKYAPLAYLANVYCTIGSLLASPDDNFWNPEKEDRIPDFSAIGITKGDYAAGARQAYEKALAYAERLIPGSATHEDGCEYELVEKFGDLFAYDPAFSRNGYTAHVNPEQIFSITGAITSNIAYPYVGYRLPEYAEGTSATASYTNAGRCRPTRFLFQKWCSTYPGKLSVVLENDAYENSADPRLDLSFYHGSMNKTIGGSLSVFYPLSNSSSKGPAYPYYKKTASKRGDYNTSDADVIMMRLAQVYLIAAESAAYLDNEAKAREYIEALHARARHSVADGASDASMPSWNNVTFAGKQELLDAIFWESEFELAGESQDYFNVHRHGARWIIKNICIPKNAFWALSDNASLKKSLLPDFVYPENYEASPSDISGDVFKVRKGLLFTFPTEELYYNSAISTEQSLNDYNYDR